MIGVDIYRERKRKRKSVLDDEREERVCWTMKRLLCTQEHMCERCVDGGRTSEDGMVRGMLLVWSESMLGYVIGDSDISLLPETHIKGVLKK